MVEESEELMRWKASQAQEWARQVRDAAIRLKARQDALAELQSSYDGLRSMSYDQDSHSIANEPGSAIIRILTRLERMQEKLIEESLGWQELTDSFLYAISRLDAQYEALLMMRYVQAKTWQEIANALHYSSGYARNEMHLHALSDLYDVMPQHLRCIPNAIDE